MALLAYLRKNGDSLIAALAGFCIVIWLCHHGGIGVSPDSVFYVSAAENMYDHQGLKDFSQLPLIDFPAFYPIFLKSIITITGFRPLAYGPWLNGFLFGLIIYLSGAMMNRFSFSSRWYKWIVLSCIVLSPSLQEVYVMLWSETLFIALLLLLMLSLFQYYRSHSLRMLLVMALLAGISCITRYAGIAFIATVACLLLVHPGLPWKKKLLHFGIFLPVAALLPAFNLIHNFRASGTLTGYREKAIRTFWDNISDTGSVFGNWLPFFKNYPAAAPLLALTLIAIIGFSWLWRLFRNRQFNSAENIAAGFFLSYTLFMIISASLSRYQPLDNRLLCPVFIPLIWTIGSWWMQAIRFTGRGPKKAAITAGLLFYVCFQYNQLSADTDTWTDIRHAGIPGYTEDQWLQSPTVQFIQHNKALFRYGFGIYSNAHDAVWLFTGMKAELLPHQDFPKDIRQFADEKHCYVVWFDDGYNPDLLGLDYIIHVKQMKLLKQLSDGAVYITE